MPGEGLQVCGSGVALLDGALHAVEESVLVPSGRLVQPDVRLLETRQHILGHGILGICMGGES